MEKLIKKIIREETEAGNLITLEDVLNIPKNIINNNINNEIIPERKFIYEQVRNYLNITESIKILNSIKIFINEDGKSEPDMVWDFSEVKEKLDLSKEWVKTKEDVIKYLKILMNKIKSIPTGTRKKILKYVLYSFLGILTIKQIKSVESQVSASFTPSQIKSELPINKKETPVIKKTEIRAPSENLFNHLKKEEGIGGEPVLYFYDLGDGAYTTGYGHAVFSNSGRGSTGGDYEFVPKYKDIVPYSRKNSNKKITTITKQQAEQLLKDDMLKASEGVNTILDEWKSNGINPKITQGMYDAMVSIAYNHGVANLRMSKFIQYVKRSQFQKAKEEIKNISSNMFDKYPGLKIRREKESKMFA